jgi:lauroyl/myristoyl acyltransferase
MGPVQMALRLGTPLLPVCVYRLPDDSYMAEAAPLVIAESTGEPAADEARVALELLRPIEDFIRRHPEQWHVPHRIWEGGP